MISNRALENFRTFMSPKGAYDAVPRLSRDGIPLKEFERGGAFDSPAVGDSLTKFKAFLKLNLPPAAVVEGSHLLANLLDILEVDDDGDLTSSDPDAASDDRRQRALARDALPARRPTESQREAFAKRFPQVAAVKHV